MSKAAASLRDIVFAPAPKWISVFVAVLFIVEFIRYLTSSGDFNVFFIAAMRWLSGASVHVFEPGVFTYPTVTALLFVPLVPLGYDAAKIVYFLLSFICLVVSIRIVNAHVLVAFKKPNLAFLISILVCGRYFLAVFDNQQTDFFIFALVVIGLHGYTHRSPLAGGAWAVAAAVKANPLYLLVLPVCQRRWTTVLVMLGALAMLLALPDVLRSVPGNGTPETIQTGEIALPRVIFDYRERYEPKTYVIKPRAEKHRSYWSEYLNLTANTKGPKWWEDPTNPLNQSLVRISKRYIPLNVSSTIIMLAWCGFFALLLWHLIARAKTSIFDIGLMAYAAFVMIGPVSSKPHFIAMYGVILLACRSLLARPSSVLIIAFVVFALLFGFSSRGIMRGFTDDFAISGFIGIASFVLWIIAYLCLVRSARHSALAVAPQG